MSIVTLVSGGLDSTLMSLMAFEEGVASFPLFIDYGQLCAEKEWAVCQQLHSRYGLPQVTRMDMAGFGRVVASGITNSSLRINEDAFLPGRNLLLLLCGASYAYKVQASSVAIGLLDPSDHLFPDQTQDFLRMSEEMIQLSLGTHVSVLAPLSELAKADVLAMAESRGLYGTYSCHAGAEAPCGQCVACVEIARARERS